MNNQYTVLVTGGNRGIGLGTVKVFAEAGHKVIMASRDTDSGNIARDKLGQLAQSVTVLEMDVSNRESINNGLKVLEQDKVEVDVLVNNAGVLPDGDLVSLSDDEIDLSFAVNVVGPLHLARKLAPGMYDRSFGRIVNVSSDWGAFSGGMGGPGAYGITKAALNATTVRLAQDLPDCIKVNAMDPGWVQTRMGGAGAPRTPAQAAITALWLGTLTDDGPNGGFFRDKEPVEW